MLESLLESWLEYEGSVQTLKTWFTAQEEKLKKKHRIEDLASVQNALKDCKVRHDTVSNRGFKSLVPSNMSAGPQHLERLVIMKCMVLLMFLLRTQKTLLYISGYIWEICSLKNKNVPPPYLYF